MRSCNSVHILDRLEFACNLLKGLALAIEGLEDSDAVNGLTAVLMATQSCLGEVIEAAAGVGRAEKDDACELAI